MKKYIFLALLTMGVSSCQLVDVLDQKPEFEADLDGAITTPAAVELALNGIYYSLPGNGFNVIFPTVSGSFKAGTMWRQEIVSAGNAVYYSERMLPTLSFSDATEWDADYAVIKNANFLETACNRMSDGEFSGNRRAEVLGEIAYLRALAYFNILVRYCEFWDMNSEYGVVMRNEAPSVSNALKARSSVADSYQYILDQLEIAIEKAPDWKKLSQASKEAAKALKARVLLYAGKYTFLISFQQPKRFYSLVYSTKKMPPTLQPVSNVTVTAPRKNKVTGGPPMSMWNWWGMILAPMPSSLK